MQEEVTSLKMTIAQLELKQLEVIDKLSEKHDDYVIRCITCPETSKVLAVNGDWERVTGFKESSCVGIDINKFITRRQLSTPIPDGEFENYNCDIIIKDGSSVTVHWKTKHFSNIDATVSIGRVRK